LPDVVRGDQIKGVRMYGECDTLADLWLENLKERVHFQDTDVDGRTIKEWNLNTHYLGCAMDSSVFEGSLWLS
jgi:hypothetical protein